MTTTDVPSYTADLYSDEAIADPYPHYRALRDLGPVTATNGSGTVPTRST